MDEILTPHQAQQIAGISSTTYSTWCIDYRMPHTTKGRYRMCKKSDLLHMIETRNEHGRGWTSKLRWNVKATTPPPPPIEKWSLEPSSTARDVMKYARERANMIRDFLAELERQRYAGKTRR